ncbi:hypothetical protein [Nonomuraea cypriaca]|uniref:hypothetical protein n=1 Tax=Nonomuraea cypriaca TaxID=1187855 RepID=UPI001A9CA498|nr:hypothetical protein [Nonomuraea cypriaca]
MTSSPDPSEHESRWPYQEPVHAPPSHQVLSVIGFVCAVVAVLFIPILFGLAGIVLGIVGHTRGEPLGKWAAVAAGIGMIAGIVLGVLLMATGPRG